MSLNFDDDVEYVPRNIFRETETEAPREAAGSEADWRALGQMLFRVLRDFPDAFRAVVAELRKLDLGLQPAPAT